MKDVNNEVTSFDRVPYPTDPVDIMRVKLVKLIVSTANASLSVDAVVDAYNLRGAWLRQYPRDWTIIKTGNRLANILEERGAKVADLKYLQQERKQNFGVITWEWLVERLS